MWQHFSANKFAYIPAGVGGQTMLSKADECRAKAFECLERAARTRDAEARLILLQDFTRYWWRSAELKRIEQFDGTPNRQAMAVT
jgi:hypothetical protein